MEDAARGQCGEAVSRQREDLGPVDLAEFERRRAVAVYGEDGAANRRAEPDRGVGGASDDLVPDDEGDGAVVCNTQLRFSVAVGRAEVDAVRHEGGLAKRRDGNENEHEEGRAEEFRQTTRAALQLRNARVGIERVHTWT